MEKTDRGFPIKEFDDYYENKCSLQMSSLADKEAVWLGIASPKVQILNRPGWDNYDLPKDVLISSRMHLTRGMVAELIPYLQVFVDTGNLEDIDPLLEKALDSKYKEDEDGNR